MKKTFPVTAPGKDAARVRDKIRHEINKYVRREQRKTLPEAAGRWQFTCRLGTSEADAQAWELKELGRAIDALAAEGATHVFVDIAASAVARKNPRRQ